MGYSRKAKGAALPGFQELVEQDLKPGKFRSVYLLAGEDTLRMEGVIQKIRKDVLGESGSVFNYHVFQGDQTPVEKVLQQALSLPMLGNKQVIWVKQADKCLGGSDGQGALEKYLSRPVDETILILTAEKVDKRKKWVKVCQEGRFLFDFTPPAGEMLIQWVLKAARRENLPLEAEQAQVLCELVGNDLLSLKSEIDKLALLAEDRGGGISSEEIGRIIMDQAALEGYEITANLEPGKAPQVLKTWYRLSEWGRSAYEIAPLIISRVRKGSILAAGRSAGMNDREIGALSGQNPWSFRYLEPMVRGMGGQGLGNALGSALSCDRRLKGSPLKPNIIIEKLILDLCRDQND
ncbi:MAG: DNA polymerase III subunit delta [Candidatus Krumholzibacteriota bacterium]